VRVFMRSGGARERVCASECAPQPPTHIHTHTSHTDTHTHLVSARAVAAARVPPPSCALRARGGRDSRLARSLAHGGSPRETESGERAAPPTLKAHLAMRHCAARGWPVARVLTKKRDV